MSDIQTLPDWYECPECATAMFYQIKFLNVHKRPPTWADAMAHCCPLLQQDLTKRLASIGIDVNSTDIRGGIKSKAELDERLAIASELGQLPEAMVALRTAEGIAPDDNTHTK